MTELETSMLYEAAYSEIGALIETIRHKQIKNADAARKAGEEPNQHYKIVLKSLKNAQEAIRKKSDDAFIRHKNALKDINDDGVENLANAVIIRAAEDYELALCRNDYEALGAIEDFAKTNAKLYTTVDVMYMLNRINSAYKRFKKKANTEIESLIVDTAYLKKTRDHDGIGSKRNTHRCPLCQGGMYVRSKPRKNQYLVGCTSCLLTEVVTLRT